MLEDVVDMDMATASFSVSWLCCIFWQPRHSPPSLLLMCWLWRSWLMSIGRLLAWALPKTGPPGVSSGRSRMLMVVWEKEAITTTLTVRDEMCEAGGTVR